jgi:hypothetical protein
MRGTAADDTDTVAPRLAHQHRAEPPRVYFPACGVLCDVFWWARRSPAEPPVPPETYNPPKR